MTKVLLAIFAFSIPCLVCSQTILGTGDQPRLAIDPSGIVRLVYGEKQKIFYAESKDNGVTFSKPVVVAEIAGMHLGMTRGPQIASSIDNTVVTAMDQQGNIHSFVMNHVTGDWKKLGRVNDVDGSAPEGLMSVAADENNHFYAVWLDLRNARKNNICFSAFQNGKWSKNTFAYVSPEDHVCECCQPSISVRGKKLSIMFRNWLKGSRDLYLTTSNDGGKTFSTAQKLGNGTWTLKGCPMDVGGIAIDADNKIHTAWQRDGIVYYAEPGQPEQKVGEGRHVSVAGSVMMWESSQGLVMKDVNKADTHTVGEGKALSAIKMKDNFILAVWKSGDEIIFRRLKG